MIQFLIKCWKYVKWSQKTVFLAFFQRFSDHVLLLPTNDAHTLCQMEGLMEIHNHGKFHLYIISGCPIINFQMFSWRCSIHELVHFGGFWGPNSPKYGPILLKLAPEVAFKETQTLCQEFWKNSNFCRNGRHPKFLRLVPLWPPFSPWR